MLIFLNADGSAQKVTPEHIYQGSTQVNQIEVIAPYDNLTAMSIAFSLPNGTATTYMPMLYPTTQPYSLQGLFAWNYSIPYAVTENEGTVGIVINAVGSTGNRTSYQVSFLVETSILPEPPAEPEADTWELLLQYYQLNASQIADHETRISTNEADIANLEPRVTANETDIDTLQFEMAQAQIDIIELQDEVLLNDFTVDIETGVGTKYYNDGTTATVQFPSSGSTVFGNNLTVITFTADSFVGGELAFSKLITGQDSNKFIVAVDKENTEDIVGFNQLNVEVFKGSDGSILVSGVVEPFDGRLLLTTDKCSIQEIVNAYIVGATELAEDWLSETEGGSALIPDTTKVYVILTDGDYKNKTVRWSGVVYVVSASNLILGTTPGTAYDGGSGYANALAIETKEPLLPETPESPENKFLNGNKKFVSVAVGSGGYAANIYLQSTNSPIDPTYKSLNYIPESAETIITRTISNDSILVNTYLFDQEINTTLVDSGLWNIISRCKISSTPGDSKFIYEIFKRTSLGVETTLFTVNSPLLNNVEYEYINTETTQQGFTVLETDRLGIRVYFNTTSVAPITVYLIVGDGYASYVTTPISLRHSQLRAKNEEDSYQHITSTQKTKLDNVNIVYRALSELDGITTSSTMANVVDAMVDNSELFVNMVGYTNLLPTDLTDANAFLYIARITPYRVFLRLSYQGVGAISRIYTGTYRLDSGFSGWQKNISNKNYVTSPAEIGLTLPCTTVQILNALPINSTYFYSVENDITDAPLQFGIMVIHKGNTTNRVRIEISSSLNSDSISLYRAQFAYDVATQSFTSVTWQKTASFDIAWSSGTSGSLTLPAGDYQFMLGDSHNFGLVTFNGSTTTSSSTVSFSTAYLYYLTILSTGVVTIKSKEMAAGAEATVAAQTVKYRKLN